MKKMLNVLGLILVISVSLASVVLAQDQSGFISIDCGIQNGFSYKDENTGIEYVSDEGFIDSGISKNISPEFKNTITEQQFLNVRSFPEGVRNCYTLNPAQGKGNKYLIRASFMYGNYDGLRNPPEFDLYLGANMWDTVKLDNASSISTMEMIHLAQLDHIYVCLVNKGAGTPFISELELRLLKNSTYGTPYGSLVLYRRLDIASSTNLSVRYKEDVYDRVWSPRHFLSCRELRTSLLVKTNEEQQFLQPSIVMSSAATPKNESDPLKFYWAPDDPKAKYYVYMHFAEVEELRADERREFRIYLNGNEISNSPIVPDFLTSFTTYNVAPYSGEELVFSLNRTKRSTLPPIINALEVYMVKELPQSFTNKEDADAILNIKSKYGVKRLWQGDPCTPASHQWDGLNCSYDGFSPPRIISVNLSSSGLTGEIAPYFSNLTSTQYLDLSNNNLTGTIPEFISRFQFLRVLNLEGNKLTGSIPVELLEKSNRGSLLLSVGGNSGLCSAPSCQQNAKKGANKFVIPLIASAAALVLVIAAFALIWILKRRNLKVSTKEDAGVDTKFGGPLDPQNRYYTYSDIIKITNNFEKILGKGGFGSVFLGFLDDKQVAVKMLSSSSLQGHKEFHAEVQLLMRVHHRNLTALIGYCNESDHMGLIYEYMANGDLAHYLSGRSTHILSWEERLQIARDTAEGLAYLHHGCKPPIVHRDVKSTNILLNHRFEAKLADFGLSRSCMTETRTHISTLIAGTPGYLDPKYYETGQLNEKSDVYSFAVVLLEIITGRPAITRIDSVNVHITDWVSSLFAKGDIKTIVDPNLTEKFNPSSAWKIAEIALACVSQISAERPTMSEVVMELKECLENETAHEREWLLTNPKDITKMMSLNVSEETMPEAR